MTYKFKAKTISLSLFLVFILTTGTIASIFPSSFFIGTVQAQISYEMDNNYNKLYKKDNYNNKYYKSQKDDSKSFDPNKIKCINTNLNINGVNSGDVNVGNKGQVEQLASSFGYGERDSDGYNKKNKDFNCIIDNNNNNNERVLGPTPPLSLPRGGSVFIEWTDSGQILFRASNDGGRTFGTTQNISNGEGSDGDIASFGQSIYIVWNVDNVPGGDEEIFFRASNDGGQTFGQILNLSNNPTESQIGRVAAYGQNVYVVWEDTASGNEEIFFRASTDGGQTFGQVQNLSMDEVDSDNPDIYAYGQNVYVVWNAFDPSTGDREVFFRASDDGGQTFGQIQNLSSNAGTSDSPKITAYEQNVYVVWEDETLGNEPEIFFRASTDGGQTFGDIQNLSNNDGFSINPRIATFGQNVYVIWQDNTLGNSEIFFRSSTNNGQTFGSEENLSTNNASSERPDIGVSGQNVYVVWTNDPETNSEIFFRASTNGGQTFGDIQNISMTLGNSILPGIAVS